jgi:hypothetical protein
LPVSFGLNLSKNASNPNASKVLPSINLDSLYLEDIADEANGLPPRFGYPHAVNYNLNNSGEWITLQNGDKIWTLDIECSGALSINLLYDYFWVVSLIV